jgi:NAD(P)-dependent dehydrogenase (short-subunit alcohol dehydrogenase family)
MTTGTALVTGGTRGIGLGIAQALARDGWHLVLVGTRPSAEVAPVLDDLAGAAALPSPESRTPSPQSPVPSPQPRVRRPAYVAADLASRDARMQLLGELRQLGPIHALVNNAGRAPRVRADVLEASEESFDELMRTNLQGPYFLTQAIARDMLERKREDPSFAASIVFITSVSATMASVNRGDYCISKAGLSMAARLFAARLASDGIPVFEVRPGVIATDMTARVKELYDRRIADGLIPEGRWGDPADVGQIVAALVRGDAPYATGTVINVDGGLSIPRL